MATHASTESTAGAGAGAEGGGGARRRGRRSGPFAKYTVQAVVAEAELVTPTMRRILLAAHRPVTFPYSPGQHVRVEINDPLSMYGILRPGETLRTYTIWDFDPEARTIELRVHLHPGEGIGRTWASEAAPGDPVRLWWPQGDFFLRTAPYHLFVGEETATAAFGPMIRELGPSAHVYGVLESESPAHDLPLPGPYRLHRVHRHGAPAASSQTLLAAVADLELPADAAGAAYVAGEARTCQLIRNHLVNDRGWPRQAIKTKPFWTPGKRGLH